MNIDDIDPAFFRVLKGRDAQRTGCLSTDAADSVIGMTLANSIDNAFPSLQTRFLQAFTTCAGMAYRFHDAAAAIAIAAILFFACSRSHLARA
ncbi:hypothetical protein [Pseudoxanthomonas sacheonensis]|uniref:hypothetical protein n=1 Tax=Pseudoxanthomonas sacheonensis TaxID=443615 RepID=UPI0013D0B38A|nr:hypothetical protein [Pseudoxanthomonas sacheonensis]